MTSIWSKRILYEEARQCGLGTEKYTRDGRRISTGGGAHITIGGKTTRESPLLFFQVIRPGNRVQRQTQPDWRVPSEQM